MIMRPIDVLNNIKGHDYDISSYSLSRAEADVCIRALQDGWIPVEDRLPEVNEEGCSDYILLSFDNFNVPAVGRYEEDEDGDGNFFQGDEDRSCLSYGLFVNAWQPLVKRYEGEIK